MIYKVLLVEDNENLGYMLKEYLEKLSYRLGYLRKFS
jgi:DNA-binding response OmpR family regulator